MTTRDTLLIRALKASLEAGKETLKYYQSDLKIYRKADNSALTMADIDSNVVITEMLKPEGIPIISEESDAVDFSVRKDWELLWLVDPLDGTREFINKSGEYTINIALIERGSPTMGVVYAPAINVLYFARHGEGSYKSLIKENDSIEEILKRAVRLKTSVLNESVRIVASKSHLNAATEEYIRKLGEYIHIGKMNSYGSSLKICMIAEGEADIYPRLGPTMEWDTAAGHAIAMYAGCKIISLETRGMLTYNKAELLNPSFVVFNPALTGIVSAVIR